MTPGNIEDVEAGSSAASLTAVEDVTMDDAQQEPVETDGDGIPEPEEEEDVSVQKIKLLPGSTSSAASYEIVDEGHTLGNALRYIIMKNDQVEFCAYAIPHPSEPKMNLRIQTIPPYTAVEAFEKGLKDLEDACDAITDQFMDAKNKFATQGPPDIAMAGA